MDKKPDAFRYDFSIKELFYFLFRKKKCPKCGSLMNKTKEYEIVEGKNFSGRSGVWHNRRVKHYIYKFKCEQCKTQYTLEELAKKQ